MTDRHIHSIQEAEAALRPYVPLVAQLTGKDKTLQRIRPLMELLDNPQNKLKIVHIAGTSGKTSTAYFTAALLKEAGYRVGLTISPHIDSITERIQIDGRPLDETRFCEQLEAFLQIVERAPERPSYFELLYAFSFWIFMQEKIDYAVVETGMGGLYDATNVAERADKICVLTDIGYDHMAILGDTLRAIATQKAGIIHEHNVALMYRQAPEIMRVVEERVTSRDARLVVTTEEQEAKVYQSGLESLPAYQRRNWLLSYRAYRLLQERDGLPKLQPNAIRASQALQVPARMDIRQWQDKIIVMDGAHNVQKMTAFVDSFQARFPGARPAVLLALKRGKESHGLGPLLKRLGGRTILTNFQTSQDLPARSVEPAALAEILKQEDLSDLRPIPDQHAAWQAALAGPEKIIIITGSFYLLAQLRQREGLISVRI